MSRKRIGGISALAVVGVVAVLAVTPFGGAAVRHVAGLIAPTSKSAVAQVNAFVNWDPSMGSRDGFSKVTHFDTGIYCLTGRANPDKSMLKLTVDQQHTDMSNGGPGALAWDRSSPNCGPGLYEVYTYLYDGTLTDNVAFFAEAYVR